MSEFKEMLNQAFGEVETTETPSEEVSETTMEDMATDKTAETETETETEETEEEVEVEEPQKFVLKNKIDGDKEVTLEELLIYGQKGTDYDRIKTRQKEHDDIVKLFYPELKNVENLLKAIRENEMNLAKKDYLEKGYDEKDIEKLLETDVRFKKRDKIDEELTPEQETEKLSKEFESDVKSINEQFGTDFKSYKDLDGSVRDKASEHNISLVDAYYLVNKDKIIADAKNKTKKSLVADIKDKKSKDVPKTGSPSEEVFVTDFDKKLGNIFGFDKNDLSDIAKKRKK